MSKGETLTKSRGYMEIEATVKDKDGNVKDTETQKIPVEELIRKIVIDEISKLDGDGDN